MLRPARWPRVTPDKWRPAGIARFLTRPNPDFLLATVYRSLPAVIRRARPQAIRELFYFHGEPHRRTHHRTEQPAPADPDRGGHCPHPRGPSHHRAHRA